jgi:quinol---cytochrome c reductase iron-sulfur subunit, bacillus type
MDRAGDAADSRDAPPKGSKVTRRTFLAWVGGLAAGAVTAALAVIGLRPIVAPMFRDQKAPWTPVGSITSTEAGQPGLSEAGTVVSSSFTRTVADAYLPPEDQKTPVFIRCEGGEEFTVFDARCTHLGCPLSWSSTSRQFLCACHGAIFDERGEVTDGPPPRPLDRYDWKVEDGVLYVGRLGEGPA